jgi:hypothetical protein
MNPDRLRSSAARLREVASRHTSQVARRVEKVSPLSAGVVGNDAVAEALRGFITRLREVALVQGRKLHSDAAALVASAASTTEADTHNADILDGQHGRTHDHQHQGGHGRADKRDRHDDRNDDRNDDRDDERRSEASTGSGKRVRR